MQQINNYQQLIENQDFTKILKDILKTIETPIRKYKIHISNLSYETKVFEIREIFNKKGIKIKGLKLFKERGFCYIKLFTVEDFVRSFSIKEKIRERYIVIKRARR